VHTTTARAFRAAFWTTRSSGSARRFVGRPRRARFSFVIAVHGQMLVSASIADRVQNSLQDLGIGWRVVERLFAGTQFPDGTPLEVVDVYELRPRKEHDREFDVFDLVERLREPLNPEDKRKVSPNHVLIPAPEWHSCPSGPPNPPQPPLGPGGNRQLEQPSGPTVPVTVIDASYLWSPWWDNMGHPPGFAITRANPLDVRGHMTVIGTRGSWSALHPPTVIDALAGHANFVAGIVAQHCPNAEITVRTFDGGFAPNSDDLAVESILLPALVDSVTIDGAAVINFGYSYQPLGGTPHQAWDTVLTLIGPDRILTVPAGNQQSVCPHYPAALPHNNVLGVASIDKSKDGVSLQLSDDFSNHGQWVKCSAIGKDVVSTFLRVDNVTCEDDPPGPKAAKTFDCWAQWSGTSFAVPKVAAAIAYAMTKSLAAGNPITAYDAWDKVVGPSGVQDPNRPTDVGIQFDF
jgi:hypothetical protein